MSLKKKIPSAPWASFHYFPDRAIYKNVRLIDSRLLLDTLLFAANLDRDQSSPTPFLPFIYFIIILNDKTSPPPLPQVKGTREIVINKNLFFPLAGLSMGFCINLCIQNTSKYRSNN